MALRIRSLQSPTSRDPHGRRSARTRPASSGAHDVTTSMTSEVMEGPRQVRYREADALHHHRHRAGRHAAARLAPAPPPSQLDLALEADVSARHLSFLETGRAVPSREMVLHLAERLEVPLRERNACCRRRLRADVRRAPLDDPALDAARRGRAGAAAHEPYPALAVDRHWALVAYNRVVPAAARGLSPPALLSRRSTCCA